MYLGMYACVYIYMYADTMVFLNPPGKEIKEIKDLLHILKQVMLAMHVNAGFEIKLPSHLLPLPLRRLPRINQVTIKSSSSSWEDLPHILSSPPLLFFCCVRGANPAQN